MMASIRMTRLFSGAVAADGESVEALFPKPELDALSPGLRLLPCWH